MVALVGSLICIGTQIIKQCEGMGGGGKYSGCDNCPRPYNNIRHYCIYIYICIAEQKNYLTIIYVDTLPTVACDAMCSWFNSRQLVTCWLLQPNHFINLFSVNIIIFIASEQRYMGSRVLSPAEVILTCKTSING